MSENLDYVEQVKDQLHQLMRGMSRARSASLATTSLTMQQFRVLTLLHAEGTLPGLALSRELGVSMATVTGLIDRLVGKGLVSRTEDPTDRRVRLIRLTREGQHEIDELVVTGDTITAEFIAKMTLEERQHILEGFVIVLRIARELAEEAEQAATAEPDQA